MRLHQRGNPFAGAVRHVQADDVDALKDDLTKPLAAFGGGADRSNDLGVPVVTAHVQSR